MNKRPRSKLCKSTTGSLSSYIGVKKLSTMQLLLKQYTSAFASLVASPLNVIVIFTKSTVVTNKVWVLVKTVNFVKFNVYNLCKNSVVFVNADFFNGKNTPVVLFKTKR